MQRRHFLCAAAVSLLGAAPGWSAGPHPETYPEHLISDFCHRLRPLGRILEEPGYYVWCNAPILGDDGRVHVFYSRWPQRYGMGGWLTACEIAHAVAEEPEGPYETVDVALRPRGAGHWDATTCHNPHIQRIGDTYCLFYMGSSNGKTSGKRIGLAQATSLNGPWKRTAEPILLPGAEGAWDDHCTTNPSFVAAAGGQCWLYYKSWRTADYLHDPPPIRGNRQYGLAIADTPAGPYRKHPDNPLVNFQPLGENRQCEDAYVWQQQGHFKMIVRDMGVFNHEVGLYLESSDGVQWSEPKIAYYPLNRYFDQPPAPKGLKRYGRMERPQLLMKEGRPTHLFGASQGGQYGTSSGVVFAIDDAG